MVSPDLAEIPVRFTSAERRLIEDLAAMRRVTASDVVRELMGFARHGEAPAVRHLHVVPTQRERRRAAACVR